MPPQQRADSHPANPPSSGSEPEQPILETVKHHRPDGSDFRISSSHEFVYGMLYIVDYTDADDDEDDAYVYVIDGKMQVYDDIKEVAMGVGRVSKASSTIGSLLEMSGIPGALALIITVTICWLAIRHTTGEPLEIPEILANALTIILGFYFGSAVQKAAHGKL